MKKNNIIKAITKNSKIEDYIFFLCSIAVLVFSILIYAGVLNIKSDNGEPVNKNIFGTILLVFGIIGVIYSIFKFKSSIEKRKSLFYELSVSLTDSDIKNKLSILEKNNDEINIERHTDSLYIEIKYELGSFCSYLSYDSVEYYFEYDLADDEEPTTKQINVMENMSKEYKTSELSIDDVFKKFISYINDNIENL